MRLADLTKPQWDLAIAAGRQLMSGDPRVEADRLAYRESVERFMVSLDRDVETEVISDLIKQAARWAMVNDIAATLAGLPLEKPA